jgi:hypothetical protein
MQKWTSTIVAILLLNAFLSLLHSCGENEPHGPVPEIYSINPGGGVIGRNVTIYGNNFVPEVPMEEGTGPHPNTSIVKFNGIVAEAEHVYQDSTGKQRINTVVPEGTTSGPITVTAMGNTGTSTDDFIVTVPNYLPNVTVSTVSSYGGIDVDIDDSGNLFLANNDRYKIFKILPDGSLTTLWSSREGENEMVLGITLDKNGNIYATIENTIRKITPDGAVSILAGNSAPGFADGPGDSAKFNFPFGITIDLNGNVYTTDFFNNKIRKITPDGIVTTVAGGTQGYSDGQGDHAQFTNPRDITLDNEGNLYVTESDRIRKITPDGFVSTIAGTTSGYLDGSVNTAQFGYIVGIVVDLSGNIYICDEGNFVVRKISGDGTVATVAGSISGLMDGPGEFAQFYHTLGLTIDSDGALYLTQGGGFGGVRMIVIE